MTIYVHIERLLSFSVDKGLLSTWDVRYARNALLKLFHLDGIEPLPTPEEVELDSPVSILHDMLDYAVQHGLIEEDTVTERDLFDAKIMDAVLPYPSSIIRSFYETYEQEGALASTDWFYELSKDSNYIRTERIAKNMHWYSPTAYGDLEITINLSKPEKDPKAIAAAKSNTSSSYPLCLLCKENEGYAGRLDHPARDQHRIIPVELEGTEWYLQYSPYVYYNEHAIILSQQHEPMEISKAGFARLLHFVEQFPHYFVGSNADLPIVGGSILSHDHFQGGHHDFPMAKAPIQEKMQVKGYEDVEVGLVRWPMSVIRLKSRDRSRLTQLAEHILQSWIDYSDETVGVFAHTNGERHNTITPIARMRDGAFEMDLVLRNNRTSEEHPMGIFHPHEEVHHIKKENIGLIEVMGLAVLPGRLVEEMKVLSHHMIQGTLQAEGYDDDRIKKHIPWALDIAEHQSFDENTVMTILQEEIGKTFATVLEHAGVFKQDEQGQAAFRNFVNHL
ncbi:galactose-1-phosphate uridylyltransferase [Pontibacillus halophilus JSM 076056 = DSM 19796]|uniref:Galactose-1-phosphate uridylyltransferase n=1 Tax=Pontibacillus halophilus JSM 076056 = DSM 19796 TaxID=1385510 RepID=A0A0A5GK96_9BACI|nr:UDP-glucose--hexose-1-phosphate uridylyltransferase [Pontibacillus halophilus]KGX91653.1 galactose-1-phosphate uridylyltransferase [Pontibacillus halophilus JSM 076056 = DSM 19796]